MSTGITVKSIMLLAMAMAIAILLPVSAALPAYTGVPYPATFWSKIGKTNTVTGKVIASIGGASTGGASTSALQGIDGAYVAIVNASNVSEEYCNTTSAADGRYTFTGVNATHFEHSDPFTDPRYMVYAYEEPYGEGYSTTFGVDAASLDSPVEIWVVMPVNGTGAQNSGTASIKASVAPSPMATVTPTEVPAGGRWPLQTIAIIIAVVILVLAGAGAYLFVRRR